MRDRIAAVTLAGLLTLTAFLMISAEAQESEIGPEREANLIGFVHDVRTEDPVFAEILVHGDITSSFRYIFKTDDEGMFKASLPAGEIFILAEAKGYESVEMKISIPENEVKKIEIPMKPVSNEVKPNLLGRIMTEEGKGIQGGFTIHKENGEDLIKVRSDEDGDFSLHLRPGEYLWMAEAKGFESRRGEVKISVDEPTKLVITLHFKEEKEKMGVIVGKVLDPRGEPLPFTEIMISHMKEDDSTCCRDGEKWLETDEEGYFRAELPFGAYYLEAHHEGFHPFKEEFRLVEREPVMEMRIMLEPEEEPNRMKIHMEYIDVNSDGFPEKPLIEADVDGDEEPEIVIEMKDENSDGNPESVVFDMDLPEDEMTEMVFLVLERASRMPPFTDHGMDPFPPHEPYPDDDMEGYPEEEWDDDDEGWDESNYIDVDEDDQILPIDEGKNVDDSKSTPKDSAVDNLPVMAVSMAVLIAVLSFVVIGGYIFRIRKMN
jgi:hypothetical protein